MKKSSTVFLQMVLVALGIGAAAPLLWEPWLEGVNAHVSGLRDIYLDDPFLMLVYAGSIPFFIALYKAFRILGHVRENTFFSEATIRAFQAIKFCALAIIGFVGVEEFIIFFNHGDDDAAGAFALGIGITFICVVVAAVCGVAQKLLQNATDMKAENDLTV